MSAFPYQRYVVNCSFFFFFLLRIANADLKASNLCRHRSLPLAVGCVSSLLSFLSAHIIRAARKPWPWSETFKLLFCTRNARVQHTGSYPISLHSWRRPDVHPFFPRFEPRFSALWRAPCLNPAEQIWDFVKAFVHFNHLWGINERRRRNTRWILASYPSA